MPILFLRSSEEQPTPFHPISDFAHIGPEPAHCFSTFPLPSLQTGAKSLVSCVTDKIERVSGRSIVITDVYYLTRRAGDPEQLSDTFAPRGSI